MLSCLPVFGPRGAFENVLALKDLPEVRYLRVLGIACQLTTKLMAEEEIRVVHSLLAILHNQQEALVGLRQLIEALVARSTATFITNDIIGKILAESGVRIGIESAVLDLLDNRRFATLYDASAWLRIIDTARIRTELEVFLSEFFPSWGPLWLWRPNVERIRQFESADLKGQCRKLWRIYDLDGPDTVGRMHECLARFEPAASQRLDLRPQNAATLERLLEDLHQAHRIGGAAVNLFVYIFVDSRSDRDIIELFNACIETRNNSLCFAIHSFLKQSEAANNNTSLDGRVESIANAVTSFSSANSTQSQDVLARYIAANAVDMLQLAQNRFCERLERGLASDYVGMYVHELGSAMSQAAWIHKHITSGLHERLLLLPSSDVLKAIFLLVHDMDGPETLRFKSYLESSIGGREVIDSSRVTLDEIQEEVKFWKRSPGVARRDFARTLVRLQTLEYIWYTKCLTAMIGELDFYIEQMRHMFQLGGLEAIREFTKYLRKRRSLGQLQNECWLELLFAMIRGHGDQWLKGVAETMDFQQWLAYILDFRFIIESASPQFPGVGAGLTQNQLQWWEYLAEKHHVVEFILRHPSGERSFLWIYFPDRHSDVDLLLNILSDGSGVAPLRRQIVSRLHNDGSNLDLVVACLSTAKRATDFGRHRCELMLTRLRDGWPEEGVATLMHVWQIHPGVLAQDLALCASVRALFIRDSSPRLTPEAIRPTADRLLAAYEALIERARHLEMLRVRLRRQEPERTSTLLNRIGVDNSSAGRQFSADISEELIDAIEPVGDSEYEISFSLLGLGDLQRISIGVPEGSRMLLIRLHIRQIQRSDTALPSFCIHISPSKGNPTKHRFWNVAIPNEPSEQICNLTPTLFTFHIARHLHRGLRDIFSGGPTVLEKVYATIQKLITSAPQTCLWCQGHMPVKRWKPAACTPRCSLSLVGAPLEVRLHNLLVDPLAIDLLSHQYLRRRRRNHAGGPSSGLSRLQGATKSRD